MVHAPSVAHGSTCPSSSFLRALVHAHASSFLHIAIPSPQFVAPAVHEKVSSSEIPYHSSFLALLTITTESWRGAYGHFLSYHGSLHVPNPRVSLSWVFCVTDLRSSCHRRLSAKFDIHLSCPEPFEPRRPRPRHSAGVLPVSVCDPAFLSSSSPGSHYSVSTVSP